MEESDENEYIDEEEWVYDSDKEEGTTESNPENDLIRLMDAESFKRESSRLEEELNSEEDGEDSEMVDLDMGKRMNDTHEYDGMYVWDADEHEYPGEYQPVILEGEFDENEESAVISPSLKRLSRSLMSTRSGSERSKASLHVKIQEEPVDRLKIERAKPKPCIKDRMRKWLNRDHNQPPTESFLGRLYSERTRSLERLDDPCQIFFKRFSRPENQDNSETGGTDPDPLGRRPICACHGKIEEPSKQQTQTAPAKDSIKEHSQSLVKDPSSGVTSEEDMKRIKCTCGESEECFAWDPAPAQNTIESPREIELTVQESSKDQGRKPEPCTCDMKEAAGGEQAEDDDTQMREKLHHLMNLWFELKQRVCHCKKTGWMATRVWERRKKKICICKKIQKKRGKLLRLMNEVRNEVVDRRIEMEERMIREEKINQLYNMIGPALADEYKELSEKHRPQQKKESDSFTRMVMREFGGQLRKYRMQNLQDGNIHREHKRGDYDSLQYVELPNGSKYYGQFSRLGMEGKCIYKMVHGPVYVGSMVDGKMEGQGQLIYPNGGIVEGTWVNGTLFDPNYTFSDGLKFQPYNWKYCRMPDRRFVSEIVNGMNSPDNVHLSADHPARQIPKGCLDAGEGFYDPQKRVIIHPSTGKIIRIVGEQEGNWILQNCRREWFEEVPFSRYMYENWYAGTVFPPPGDEPEWFDKEFAKVLLPYTNVGDVIQARRLAMEAASKPSPGAGEPGYAKPQVLPPLCLN